MSTNIKVMRQLTESVRDDDWKVMASILWKECSSEIVDIVPFSAATKSFGMAIDLGTTSIVVYIVHMENGTILSAASGHNGQAACGDDVINRIVCSEKDGVQNSREWLLPDIDREKFQYMGNSSIAGAYMALLSNAYRQEAIAISSAMTYLDFSSSNGFMEAFIRAQFLPHTDADRFPTVQAKSK